MHIEPDKYAYAGAVECT